MHPKVKSIFREWRAYFQMNQITWKIINLKNNRICMRKWKSSSLNAELKQYVVRNLSDSRAQFNQDLVASYSVNTALKKNSELTQDVKFFVEFGATDGVNISNSFYLERFENWNGILAEPARVWHSSLHKNRRAKIDTRLVYSTSGLQLELTESRLASLSGISDYLSGNFYLDNMNIADRYLVDTITLTELLDIGKAPEVIGYLSIDTEGSEYEILRSFDFDSYQFVFISVEHNYGTNRYLVRDLFENKGYVNILTQFSKCDDWYINARLLSKDDFSGLQFKI